MSEKINTQLTSPYGYNTSRLVFSKPQKCSITSSNPNAAPIEYTRINIRTQNPDGSIGELIFPTDELFSFGISENISQETGNVSGHVMPLCLWSRDRDTGKSVPTDNEKRWTDTFNAVVDCVKDHLVKEKDNFDKYAEHTDDEFRVLLKKFNPLYWKKEKGKVVEGTGPTLYAKLIETKKKEQGIITKFYDYNDNQLNPMTLLKTPCHVRGAVKIESIFVGNSPSLQVKLYEAEVNVIESNVGKRLLPRPKPEGKILSNTMNNTLPLQSNDKDETGSIIDGDEEIQVNQKPPSPLQKPKISRRVALKNS